MWGVIIGIGNQSFAEHWELVGAGTRAWEVCPSTPEHPEITTTHMVLNPCIPSAARPDVIFYFNRACCLSTLAPGKDYSLMGYSMLLQYTSAALMRCEWAQNIDPTLLLTAFLPILLFAGAFALEWHTVRRLIWSSLLLAGMIPALCKL